MHHPKEAVIDGVKFVLIPEILHDNLAEYVVKQAKKGDEEALDCLQSWQEYDPEVWK